MVGFILYGCVSSAQGYIGRAIVAKVSTMLANCLFFPSPYLHPPGSTFYLSFFLFFSSFQMQGLGKGKGMYPAPYAQ